LRRSSTQRSLKFFHGLPQNSALDQAVCPHGALTAALGGVEYCDTPDDVDGAVMPIFAWFLAAILGAAGAPSAHADGPRASLHTTPECCTNSPQA
jgi:hypothetical protein